MQSYLYVVIVILIVSQYHIGSCYFLSHSAEYTPHAHDAPSYPTRTLPAVTLRWYVNPRPPIAGVEIAEKRTRSPPSRCIRFHSLLASL